MFIIAWGPPNIDEDESAGGEVGQRTDNASLPTEDSERLHFGSSRRRRRPSQFALPSTVREIPILRRKRSVNLIGISPAQVCFFRFLSSDTQLCS